MLVRRSAACGDDRLIFERVGYRRIFRINVGRILQNLLRLETYEIFACDDLARMSVDLRHIKTERILREGCDLPYQLVAVRRRIDAEARLKTVNGAHTLVQCV